MQLIGSTELLPLLKKHFSVFSFSKNIFSSRLPLFCEVTEESLQTRKTEKKKISSISLEIHHYSIIQLLSGQQ